MADIWTTVNKLTEAELKDEVVAATTPEAPAGTAMTATKIKSIVSKLRRVGAHNGYSGIAKVEGVPKAWVLEIEAARVKALSEKLAAATIEELP
ncbi:MAG: hypothetical protein ACYTBJ_00105 [Planctomycetota bacterium]|jgi:hypothetical protein